MLLEARLEDSQFIVNRQLLIASNDSTALISIYPKSRAYLSRNVTNRSENETVRVLIIVYHCLEKNNSVIKMIN